jgi:hypothetical protein
MLEVVFSLSARTISPMLDTSLVKQDYPKPMNLYATMLTGPCDSEVYDNDKRICGQ